MKAFWTLFSVLFLTFGIADQADAAKRFGSGGFGKSSPAPTQPRQAPQRQDQQQQQQPNQAAPAAGAAGKGMMGGMMGGMLGGLLAGGIFAYLLGSGAFEGIQLLDILLIALVAFIAFKLLRRRAPQPAAAYAPGTAQPQQRQSFDMGSFGGSASAATAPASAVVIDLPAGFDQQAFIEGALEHYRTVQSAWNSGNLDLIAEYVKPELFAQLANQRQQMDSAPQTDIIDLNAEIVAAGTEGNVAMISLLFRGLARDAGERSEDGIYDVWHLERDLNKDNAPWLIAGIEAE